MANSKEIYDLMLDKVSLSDAKVEDLLIGLTWTYCRSTNSGLCMTADSRSRSFEWPGKIKGEQVSQIAHWIREWDPMKSTIAQAAINSILNHIVPEEAFVLNPSSDNVNLAVFDYFLPLIKNSKSVVIGRYPGIERIQPQCASMQIVELSPGAQDFPTSACEYLLPEAEWVFLTGTSIPNKTFPRLTELSQNAHVVLMGPSVPWLPELVEFDIDFLVGVTVQDDIMLRQVISEGGGTNIFSEAVRYAVLDLGQEKMQKTRKKIQHIVNRRESLKDEMSIWYNDASKGTYPKVHELMALDEEISSLDSQFKQMWDLRQGLTKSMKYS